MKVMKHQHIHCYKDVYTLIFTKNISKVFQLAKNVWNILLIKNLFKFHRFVFNKQKNYQTLREIRFVLQIIKT